MKKIIIMGCLCVVVIATIILGVNFIHSDNVVEKLSKSVVLLEVYDDRNEMVATGSGYFIYNDKTIVTNYHVVEDAYTITAISDDNRKFEINTMIEYDEEKDIAILKCDESTGISHIPFAEMDKLKRGQEVIAIGSPLGIQNTVSTGVISSFDDENDIMKIHTTAPISSGSSGGLLSTEDGKAIGITSASYTEGQNLNIAIDIREVMTLYEDDLKNSTSLSDFFESKEHFYKYENVSVGEVLNDYPKYQYRKVCINGWISASFCDDGVDYMHNLLFLVDDPSKMLSTGVLQFPEVIDDNIEYNRASQLQSITVPNHGENVTVFQAGTPIKVYGEIRYDVQFHRIGVTTYKIELPN